MKSLVALLGLVATTSFAAPELEVHEWGTFTSISDANGVATKWHARSEDLPSFVYRSPAQLTARRDRRRSTA